VPLVNLGGGAKEPTNSGSNAIMSGWILGTKRVFKKRINGQEVAPTFSNKPLTSLSLLAFLFSKGSASALSKFGSPDPGTSMLDKPAEWPIVSISWNGQNRNEVSGRCGMGCVRYSGGGDFGIQV